MVPWSPASGLHRAGVADLPGEGAEGVQRGGQVPGIHAHAADVQGTLEVGSCTARSSCTDKYYPGLGATARCSWLDSWTGESWWGWLQGEAGSASLTETQRCSGTKGSINCTNTFITEPHLFAFLGLGLQRWHV